MLHSLLKLWSKVSLHFFFRKWQFHFHSQLPNAPIIFLANHPNAFLDAILIACSLKQNPWFLARGEVFKNKWSAWVLSKLKLIPIFRFRDGHGSLRKNEDMINRCAQLLAKGESIILFPEGENSVEERLLPLQKGFVRIAETALVQNPDTNLQLVPVGVNYNGTKGFGATALLNFGEPISFSAFSKSKSTEEILDSTWLKLNELILPSETKTSQTKPNLLVKLNSVYFAVNNFILRALMGFFDSFIKEKQMKNSVRFATGMFLTFPVYIMQASLVFKLTSSLTITAVYLGSLLFTIQIKLTDRK